MKIRKIKSAGALLAAFGLLAVSLPAYPQQAAPTKEVQAKTQSEEGPAKNRTPRTGLMSSEEKVVRDVYARLMRYHAAAREQQAATTGVSYKPEDYVVFELRDIHAGPIDEIAARQVADLVTKPTEEVLSVTAHHLQYGNGPRHSCYDVGWGSSPTTPYNDKLTVAEMLASGGDRLLEIARYTSFEVTIRLAGKERTYRAIALHYSQLDGSGKLKSDILDNITPEMNAVIGDESPRVRSPWKTYVKSGLYLAVAKQIQKAERLGKPLIPADAPIGYLVGDDAVPNGKDGQERLAVACENVDVSIEPFLGVGKDQTVNVPVTLTPSPTQTVITLTLTTTTGTGAAKFGANDSTTLNISQSAMVAIKGVTESSTADNIRLEAKLNNQSLDSDDFSVVLVTLDLRTGTDKSVSSDNSARATYISFVGRDSLGTFFATGVGGNAWGTHVEIVGTVKPANYAGTVTLEREIIEKRTYDNQTLFDDGIVTNHPDNSEDDLRDDNPQSGGSNGKVYDLDGPNIASTGQTPLNAIRRRRTNFRQWATIDGVSAQDPRIRASEDFPWFQRLSIIKTSNGDQLKSDVSDDNIAGTGKTRLTWNLQK